VDGLRGNATRGRVTGRECGGRREGREKEEIQGVEDGRLWERGRDGCFLDEDEVGEGGVNLVWEGRAESAMREEAREAFRGGNGGLGVWMRVDEKEVWRREGREGRRGCRQEGQEEEE